MISIQFLQCTIKEKIGCVWNRMSMCELNMWYYYRHQMQWDNCPCGNSKYCLLVNVKKSKIDQNAYILFCITTFDFDLNDSGCRNSNSPSSLNYVPSWALVSRNVSVLFIFVEGSGLLPSASVPNWIMTWQISMTLSWRSRICFLCPNKPCCAQAPTSTYP